MTDHGLVLLAMVVLFVQGLAMLRLHRTNGDLRDELVKLRADRDAMARAAMRLEWDIATRPCGYGDCPHFTGQARDEEGPDE